MTKPRVLFLCTGNSCRSQMAEGWARHFGRLEACSAGLNLHPLNPSAVLVMSKSGVDISGHRPKHLDDLAGAYDVVVTVCDSAHEACPALPGHVRQLHVGFDDPPRWAAEPDPLRVYRRVRDEIRALVEQLPERLG